MPHQCTNCGRAFADGSKEMLAGCPDCDGNKFQFIPQSRMDADDATTGGSPSSESTADSPSKTPADSTSRPDQGQSPVEMTPSSSADEEARASTEDDEDNAQSDARSSVVSSSELEQAKQQMAAAEEERMAQVDDEAGQQPTATTADGAGTSSRPEPAQRETAGADAGDTSAAAGDEMAEPTAEESESPDLTALREELNSQFESIKIKAPGQYELNLMELYDREEYIISLREDGRYVIEMPETWRDDE